MLERELLTAELLEEALLEAAPLDEALDDDDELDEAAALDEDSPAKAGKQLKLNNKIIEINWTKFLTKIPYLKLLRLNIKYYSNFVKQNCNNYDRLRRMIT